MLCIVNNNYDKKILLILISVVALIVLLWNFRLDMADYLFSKHVIYWSPNVELKCSGFRDESNSNPEYNAHYYYGLYLKANSTEKAFVRSYIDKNQSGIIDTTHSGLEKEMKIQKLLFDLNEV